MKKSLQLFFKLYPVTISVVNLIINILFSVYGAISGVLIPSYIAKFFIDEASFTKLIFIVFTSFFIEFIFYSVRTLFNSFVVTKYDKRFEIGIFIPLFEKMMSLDLKHFDNSKTYSDYNLAVDNGYSSCNNIGKQTIQFIPDLLRILTTTLVLTLVDWKILIVMIAAVIFSGMFNIIVSVMNRKLSKAGADYSSIVKYVENVFLLKDYAVELRTSPISNIIVDLYHKSTDKTWEYAKSQLSRMLFVDIADTITNNIIAYFGIVIYACYRISVTKEFNVDEFIILITGAFQLMSNCSGLLKAVISLGDNKVRFGYYQNFLDMSTDEDNFSKCTDCSNVKNSVCFENVSFGYKDDIKIIKDLSVDIPIGTKVAILGANGAGKTTFVKLLLRLYDVSSGEILLNGVNIQKYSFNEYIKIFSSVFQDYKLFAYSVQENIVLSEDEPDTAKLEKALEESGVNNFVDKKKHGIHSFVYKLFDASGFEPSGGEGQKIAIARALYKDAKFIILDEPTSALDPIAEYDLYNKINNLVKNKGCLFISHRLSSTVFADKVFVFNNGEIVEQGTHKELMMLDGGLYKDMFEKQSSYYKEN